MKILTGRKFNFLGNFNQFKRDKQEALTDLQGKYHTLVEDLSIGVYRNTSGPKGHFLEANSSMVSMFEAASKEEFMKHKVSDLYQYPEKRAEFVAEITKKGEVKNKELDLITLKGRRFIGSVTAVAKEDRDGNVYFDGTIEDITERKRMEAELIKSHETLEFQVNNRTKELEYAKLAMLNVMEDLEAAKNQIELERAKDEAMLASIGEGLIAVDTDRKVVMMNKAAGDMLGWESKDIIGIELTHLPLEDDDGNIISLEERPTYIALVTGKTARATYFFVKKDKTKFPIAITATPIKLDGKTIGLIEIIRDITREQEIDRAKSEFVSLASHQLRTPLGIIKWYLEALQNEDYFKKGPLQIKKYFTEINNSNERVLSLVRDLLSVSRIDQGRVKNDPKPADIVKIIRESVEQMQILAHRKEVVLTLTIRVDKILPISIDALRFHEVIENLIANGIEYTKASGTVNVMVNKIDDTLLISVKDSGIGISTRDQKKLFTKFFRSEHAVGQNPEGSGLGLYVVKSYIEGWGGKISVESSEGKGSTFTISLPILQKNNVRKEV